MYSTANRLALPPLPHICDAGLSSRKVERQPICPPLPGLCAPCTRTHLSHICMHTTQAQAPHPPTFARSSCTTPQRRRKSRRGRMVRSLLYSRMRGNLAITLVRSALLQAGKGDKKGGERGRRGQRARGRGQGQRRAAAARPRTARHGTAQHCLHGPSGQRALNRPACYQHGMCGMHSMQSTMAACTACSAPEPDRILEELELAPHGDDAHLEDLGARLGEALEVGGTQAQLVQQQHLQLGRERAQAGKQAGMCGVGIVWVWYCVAALEQGIGARAPHIGLWLALTARC